MSSQNPSPSVLRWTEWILLNTLAVGSAAFLSLTVLPSAAGALGLEVTDRAISLVMATLIGLLLSLGQWLLVRSHLPRPLLWIPSTFLGWILPLVILFTFFPPSVERQQLQIAMLLVSIGVFTGIAQYLVLRPVRRHAPIWIVASVLGWLLLAISLPVPMSNNTELIKLGAVPALITGLAFVLVVSLPTPHSQKQHPA